MTSTPLQDLLELHGDKSLAHVGVKGMKWGVRRDERPLGIQDRALNVAQRSQVKVASTISALAAAGMATNAAATLFQLQARIERYQVAKALLDEAENNPLITDAGREAIKRTKSHIIQGIVGSAMATTAVTIAIGIVTQRTAKAYFAPVHKVYGDSKGRINSDLKRLSKDIKAGKRPTMTVKDYNQEVAGIVAKHMTADRKNLLSPFHEMARQQLGTEYNTKNLNIKFEKLPNTDLYDKMTIVTPNGLKLVKAIKRVEHADLGEDSTRPVGDIEWFFDYKFDADGYIEEWSCPTLEVANDIVEGNFDMDKVSSKYAGTVEQSDKEEGMTSNALTDLLSVHGDKKLEHVAGMTTSVAVVALPKQLDRVRLIGTEEKHATLLFLGEMSTLPNEARNELLQTLRGVSEIVAPFTERILRVERLGEETPPALVCKLRDSRLSQLRDMLLVNHRVKDYLENTQQYPTYTPHVTLGYPDYAQEAELRKTTDGISGITFDRIALWWGNERLEFPLMEHSRLDEDVPMEKSAAWSEEARDVLAHAERTIQDVVNELSPEMRDSFDILIGAALEDVDVSSNDLLMTHYNSFSVEVKDVLDFVVGAALSDSEVKHSDAVEDFLAHFGVKGMKWGVRRSDEALARSALRKKVHSGEATLGEVHQAALKTTGHRVANALLGDKTYWKRAAIISGVTLTAAGASLAAPYLMPTGVLAAIGTASTGANLSGTAAAVLGGKVLTTTGLAVTQAGHFGATTYNKVTGIVRAVGGNEKINKSYESLGKLAKARQTAGTEQMNKILNQQGSIRKRDLRHSEEEVEAALAHYGRKGMKWGVVRDLKRMSPSDRAGYIEARDAKWLAKVDANPKLGKISSKAAREAKRQTKALNADYKERGLNIKKDSFARTRYDTELKGILENSLDKASYKVHKFSPSRLSEVAIHRHPDGTITALVRPRTNVKIVKQQGKIAKADSKALKRAVKDAFPDKTKRAEANKIIDPYVKHADGDVDRDDDFDEFRFILTVDEEGFVDDVQSPSGDLEQADISTMVDDFLAHFGVKGMRWGVRRSDAQLAKAAKEGVTISKDDAGRVTVSGGSRGSRKFVKANADKIIEDIEKKTRDEIEDGFISADAARLVKTTQKSSHEMSDAEIRTALNRAKMVREYDEIFGQDPSTAKLRAKVSRLELEKRLHEMEEAMKPPSRVERLKDFLGNAEQAYKSFTTLDKATGGKMSSKMNSYMGVKIPKAEEVRRTTGTTGKTKRKKSSAEQVYSITSLK